MDYFRIIERAVFLNWIIVPVDSPTVGQFSVSKMGKLSTPAFASGGIVYL